MEALEIGEGIGLLPKMHAVMTRLETVKLWGLWACGYCEDYLG